MGKSEYTEEQVREAFKLGQQWVKDINEGLDPVSLNEWLSGQDSHSPTEPDAIPGMFRKWESFDTLQEGDFFLSSNKDYETVLSMFTNRNCKDIRRAMEFSGNGLVYSSDIIISRIPNHELLEFRGKTQLTAPEFIRRADNTFKTK